MLAEEIGGEAALKSLRNLQCVPSKCRPFGGFNSVEDFLAKFAKLGELRVQGKMVDEAFASLMRVVQDLSLHPNKAKGAVQVISRMLQLMEAGHVIHRVEWRVAVKNAVNGSIGIRIVDFVTRNGTEIRRYEIKSLDPATLVSRLKESLRKNVDLADGDPPGQLFKDIVEIMRSGSTTKITWSFDKRAAGMEAQIREAIMEVVQKDPAVGAKLRKQLGLPDLLEEGGEAAWSGFLRAFRGRLQDFVEVAP